MIVNVPESSANSSSENRNLEPALHNADKLISLSAQARMLGWVILVLSILYIIAATMANLWSIVERTNYAYAPGFDDFMYYLASLSPAFIGLVFSIILRIVAESVLLLMDLEIDLRERRERQL